MQSFLHILKALTDHPDRHVKGHATALLKRLQEITDAIDKENNN